MRKNLSFISPNVTRGIIAAQRSMLPQSTSVNNVLTIATNV